MAKTLRFASRKRRSLNKRMRVLDKKTKVVRKNGSRRRIRIVGGANWIKNRGDLSNVWNSLFYDKVSKSGLVMENEDTTISPDKKALFVIDMQYDFVDIPYKRDDGEVHPIFRENNTIGNFSVAQGGNILDSSSGFIEFIRNCIDKYKYVIFSRDYHPVGHSSFNKNYFYESNLCGVCKDLDQSVCKDNDGGVFPAHCVQGKIGSKFVDAIHNILKDLSSEQISKVKVVFKGIDPETDSFTAVDKNIIDSFASNTTKTNCVGCSKVSGGYVLTKTVKNELTQDEVELTPGESADFMGEIDFANKRSGDISVKKMDYDELLKDVSTIEVCGLAGDYCVRDTVLALAEKFNKPGYKKNIILLNDYTRYAILPFGTIYSVPQHVSYNKYSKPDYKGVFGNFDDMFSIAKNDSFANKDISQYLIKYNVQNNLFSLMEKDDLTKVSIDEAKNPSNPSIQHFITPHNDIMNDYILYSNIKLYMNNDKFEKRINNINQ